MQTHNPKSS